MTDATPPSAAKRGRGRPRVVERKGRPLPPLIVSDDVLDALQTAAAQRDVPLSTIHREVLVRWAAGLTDEQEPANQPASTQH